MADLPVFLRVLAYADPEHLEHCGASCHHGYGNRCRRFGSREFDHDTRLWERTMACLAAEVEVPVA